MTVEKKRIKHLEILRGIAIIFVMFGHFVDVGTFQTGKIEGVIQNSSVLPLLPLENHILWRVGDFTYNSLHTQLPVIGVMLFFLMTGYLTCFSIEKLTVKEYIINRLAKLYPALIVSIIINGILVYTIQGISFPLQNYAASASLVYHFLGIAPVLGIFWFLVVELVFYAIAVILRKMTVEKIFLLYAVLNLFIIMVQKYPVNFLLSIAYVFRFLSFILIGCGLYCAEKMQKRQNQYATIITCILLSFITFRIYREFIVDDGITHLSVGSFTIVLLLFFGFRYMENHNYKLIHGLFAILRFPAKISYSLYLMHFVIGFITMYGLRLINTNIYLTVLCGFIAAFLSGAVLFYAVERPCAEMGKKIVNRMQTRNAVLAEAPSDFVEEKKIDSSSELLSVQNVSMMFNLSSERVDSFKEYMIRLFKNKLFYNEFWALKNISFKITPHDSLAIVGLNGSGKSTLLKLISGVLKPTSGTVSVCGSIAPLLELGAGFDMELSARENIYLNGTVLGYSKRQIEENFEDIVEFSELKEFLDVPIKNFSSGMLARLGFAIATDIQPDILILDEVLSVGDFIFQEKCEKRIQEMVERGTTVIFVSHSFKQVHKICKKALWLDHGEIKMFGDVDVVCDSYEKMV